MTMGVRLDIANRRFERLVAIEPVETKKGLTYWRCECDCGNKNFVTSRTNLLRGDAKSCGCLRRDMDKAKSEDIIGRTFERLKVIKKVAPPDPPKKSKCSYYLCECSCGNTTVAARGNLLHKTVKSCGCLGEENRVSADSSNTAPLKQGFVNGTNAFVLASGKPRKNNTSGVKGVAPRKNGKWIATIRFQNKSYYLGVYEKLEDAAAVRREAEERIHGPFLDWYEETIRPLPKRKKQESA